MNLDWINEDENALIYVGDTMCSWCYGFTKELDGFIQAHPELKLRLVQGGLRPGNRQKAKDMRDILMSHWVEIGERTGMPFKDAILNDPNFVYDTEPASRAVVVVRMLDPSKEMAFFKGVQTAFYRDNKNTNDLATYLSLAKAHGLDPEKFESLFESEEAKLATKADFQLSAEMGIQGFPALVIKKGKEFFMLSNGYQELKHLEVAYTHIMETTSK
ncbi:DsbA family protein [Putridiphycobacter roseus]|uniref:DsbA family protein n=1 Tax=Putridiphycobacter roseus TaxID=2219161 RepID=A0A2W1NF41_9FLAO|nr:DsbA family protein [Putridiphycobacter roseus]PZE18095.1 DsbA family protein [Putridiphycobacter roseus]